MKRSFIVFAITSATTVYAHSWIDCLDTSRSKLYDQSAQYIFGGSKGNGFCDGYAAGYPGRGVSDIGPMFTHKMLKNEVDAGAPVCAPVDPNTYSGWRKRLTVEAGKPIYFAYTENGHVSKDTNGRGTKHGVYWTGKIGSKLTSTKEITPDHLVDGKVHDFDDGNCGETLDSHGQKTGRAGDGKPCISDFTIPTGTPPGIYHFVWYWKFYQDKIDDYHDKDRARGYFGAAYSSCFEVQVIAGKGSPTLAPATASPTSPKPADSPAPKPTISAPKPAPIPAPAPKPAAPASVPKPAPAPPSAPPPAQPQAQAPTSAKLDFSSLSPKDVTLGSIKDTSMETPATPAYCQ